MEPRLTLVILKAANAPRAPAPGRIQLPRPKSAP
jgi:hypothetical protein